MKPDQHKKKKSFQYKKKHRMQDPICKASNDLREKGRKSKNLVEDQDVHCKKEAQLIPGQNFDSESASCGFSKRNIDNNWEKYDLLSGQDGKLGTDFIVLLSFAGAPASHIKLESEKEWEDSLNNLSPMIIDCKRLAKSINHLNIGKRYKLDKLLNDADILEYFCTADEDDLKKQPGGCILPSELVREMGFEFDKYDKSIKKVQPEMTIQCCDEETPKTSETYDENSHKTECSKSKMNELFERKSAVECEEADLGNEEHKMECCLCVSNSANTNMVQDVVNRNEMQKKNIREVDSPCVEDDSDKRLVYLGSSLKTTSLCKLEAKSLNFAQDSRTSCDKSEDSQLDNLEEWLDSIL